MDKNVIQRGTKFLVRVDRESLQQGDKALPTIERNEDDYTVYIDIIQGGGYEPEVQTF